MKHNHHARFGLGTGNRLTAVLAIAVLLLASSCATTGQQPQLTPLQTAQLTYADGSLAYETAMLTIKDAVTRNLISAAAQKQAYDAQTIVQQYSPLVRSALDLWASSGAKPASYEDARRKLDDAFAAVAAAKNGVRK